MNTFYRCTAALILGIGISSVPALTQELAVGDLEVALRAANYQASVDGDLEGAIEAYQDIAARSGSERGVAAEALLRAAAGYETLGLAQARSVYEQLVENYGDQVEPARVAKLRLAAMGVDDNGRNAPSLSAVLSEAIISAPGNWSTSYDLSPDGEEVVFIAAWDAATDPARRGPGARNGMVNIGIYVSDRVGTVIRPLLTDWGPIDDFVRDPGGLRRPEYVQRVNKLRWSPDGKQIAFTLSRPLGEGLRQPDLTGEGSVQEFYNSYAPAIFVVDAAGGSPRQIGPVGDVAFLDIWWSRDSSQLAYVARDGIYTLTLEGEATRVIEMQVNDTVRVAGYSPDGQWIAYSLRDQAGEQLFVIPANGGRAIQQAQMLSGESGARGIRLEDAFRPSWSHDGRALYATSDAGGTRNIWRYGLDPQTGSPMGAPEQVTFYTDGWTLAPRILSNGGGLAYTLLQTRSAINIVDVNRPEDIRAIARGGAPRLSPDGATLYYLGESSGQEGIFSVTADGGSARRISDHRVAMAGYDQGFKISADGAFLVYRTQSADAGEIHMLSTSSGETKTLHSYASDVPSGPPFISPDGSAVAFTQGDALYTISTEGGVPVPVANLWGWFPPFVRWSPDGQSLAVLGWDAPTANGSGIAVWVVSASGGELRRLTPIRSGITTYFEGLEWHPDGQRLSYFDYEFERTRVVDLNGQVSTLFNHDEGWEYLGHWYPDGERYHFTSSMGATWRNFVFDTQTEEIFPDINGSYDSADASATLQSRDGSTVAWTSTKVVRQVWLLQNID